MTFTSRAVLVALMFVVVAPLAGCKKEPPCETCGVVQSIAAREVKGEATGAGAVIGGIVGGVVGHQFGSGSGNDAATVGGAAGGAVAGHAIEKNMKKAVVYDVTVRMQESGTTRVITFTEPPALHEGDKVKVNGNVVERT